MNFLANNKALIALVLSLVLNALGATSVVPPVVPPSSPAVCP